MHKKATGGTHIVDAGSSGQVSSTMAEEEQVALSMNAQRLGAAFFYFVMAVAMGFVNKAALQVFPHNNTMLGIQMVITLVVVQGGSMLGVFRVRPMTWQQTKVMIPLALAYNSNVAFALAGLQRLNIPMYQTLKRLTPCVIWLMNGMTGRGWARTDVTVSLFVITGGTLVAGLGDFDLDLKAYGYAFLSCFFQATYLILAESGGEKGFSSMELLQYNAVLSLPVLAAIVYAVEWEQSFPALVDQSGSAYFVGLLLFASTAGGVLNYAIFLCATYNTALTTTVVGVMKAVVMTSLGFFVLGGAKVTFVNFSGICINTTGGCLYTYFKYLQKESKKEAAANKDLEMQNQNEPHEASSERELPVR